MKIIYRLGSPIRLGYLSLVLSLRVSAYQEMAT